MAMALSDHPNDEFHDFVTCGVCFCQFNEDERKPKFLPCSHTVCVTCLGEIIDAGKVVCPFCRNITQQSLDVQSLPNNTYALQMLKLQEEKNILPVIDDIKNSKNSSSWCFSCGSLAKLSCSLSKHCLFDMTLHTMKNIEAFIGLQEEFKKMNEEGTDKLAMALEKRKEIKKHLDMLVTSVNVTLDEIHGLQDQNNLEMAELAASIAKELPKAAASATDDPGKDLKELFLFDLKSLGENFSYEDTTETLKLKVGKSLASGEEKLSAAKSEALKFKEHKKLKIMINLLDENDQMVPTCSWLQDGFRLLYADGKDGLGCMGREDRKKLSLLSHLVYSIIQKQKQELTSQTAPRVVNSGPTPVPVNLMDQAKKESSLEATNTDVARNSSRAGVFSWESLYRNHSSSSQPLPTSPVSLLAAPVSRSYSFNESSFNFGQSVFILKIFNNLVPFGEIHIRPTTIFQGPHFVPFVKELGNFCFKSPKIFSRTRSKAVKDVLVLMPMANPLFSPETNISCTENETKKAIHLDDVGLTEVQFSQASGCFLGWSFIFPLKNYNAAKYAKQVKKCPPNKLFGHVVHRNMLDCIIQFSSAGVNAVTRNNFSMTLESR